MAVKKFVPQGVIPATLLAIDEDMSIDVRNSRKHARDVADVKGVQAITVNGHASEVHACTFDEQRLILAETVAEVGDRTPVVNGVYADGSAQAADIAAMADREGASALLVFPPRTLQDGGDMRPEMVIAHFKAIADQTALPIIAFNYAHSSGVMYSMDTMLKLFDAVPSICAVKDWCNIPSLHEAHIRTFQSLAKPVSVLTTHSAWLLGSLCMGAQGLLSGAGSIAADLQVQMFEAVQRGDLKAAQAVNERYYPLSSAFYAPPFLDMHNRMKECAVLLGRLPRSVVRPPLMKLSATEIGRLREALVLAGLM
jgi:4-hydroxy-tetrahydrodipicolinate synthase